MPGTKEGSGLSVLGTVSSHHPHPGLASPEVVSADYTLVGGPRVHFIRFAIHGGFAITEGRTKVISLGHLMMHQNKATPGHLVLPRPLVFITKFCILYVRRNPDTSDKERGILSMRHAETH